MLLKKQNNKLQEELAILKGKYEVNKGKTYKKRKEMDMEMEKEIYWGSSKAHLISGIKYQY